MGETYVINRYNTYYDENELDAQGNPVEREEIIEHSYDTKHEPEVGDSWIYKKNGKVYREVVQWVSFGGYIYEDTAEYDVGYQTVEVKPGDFFIERKNGKYGVVNDLLEVTVPYEYDILESQSQSTSYLAKAKKGGRWGLVDCRNGKVLIPVECEAVELIEMTKTTKRHWPFCKVKKTNKRYWLFCKAGKWSFFDEELNSTLTNIDDLFRVDKNGNYEIPEGTTEIYPALFKDNDVIRTIKIPETVVSIGKESFMNCKNLERVIIPESVKVIEESAFSCCRALQKIKIPKSASLEKIGSNAFNECESLKKRTFPDRVRIIEKNAFRNCKSLKDVFIPKEVEYLGRGAFIGCTNLKYVTIKEELLYKSEYWLIFPQRTTIFFHLKKRV